MPVCRPCLYCGRSTEIKKANEPTFCSAICRVKYRLKGSKKKPPGKSVHMTVIDSDWLKGRR